LELLSPLLPTKLLTPYLAAGMLVAETLVALQAAPGQIARDAELPEGVTLRHATAEDAAHVIAVDAESFGAFWRYGLPEASRLLDSERCTVATDSGAVIGYTLCTARRGVVTLTRLAVAPEARRQGIGSALLVDAAVFAEKVGAESITLCTQEGNSASRALYARSGLRELAERYAIARGTV
jgi:ribosomal-protein-alanine N-acetyltransferase